MIKGRTQYAAILASALFIAPCESGEGKANTYAVDPFWPKPFAQMESADGRPYNWVISGSGGLCIDSHDNVVTLNRRWTESDRAQFGLDTMWSGEPPPVVVYDPAGNVLSTWGDVAKLPDRLHGCFVDFEDAVWIAGNTDGIVQKYSRDGRLLLQIGTRGVCDGPANAPGSRSTRSDSCVSPGGNASRTLLNGPADATVDPNPDPVTGKQGSVYIADGYGNHRIVVFDAGGRFLRQWGSAGDAPGQFSVDGGGHPHCVRIGSDGLVYVCDRGHSRIAVFDKLGNFKRLIPIDLASMGVRRAEPLPNGLAIKSDGAMLIADGYASRVWVLDPATGRVLDGFGQMGRHAGQFLSLHAMAIDSKGNVFTAEGTGAGRVQKFVPR